jgi:hypothetical protein
LSAISVFSALKHDKINLFLFYWQSIEFLCSFSYQLKQIIVTMQLSLIFLLFDQNCVSKTEKKFKVSKIDFPPSCLEFGSVSIDDDVFNFRELVRKLVSVITGQQGPYA